LHSLKEKNWYLKTKQNNNNNKKKTTIFLITAVMNAPKEYLRHTLDSNPLLHHNSCCARPTLPYEFLQGKRSQGTLLL